MSRTPGKVTYAIATTNIKRTKRECLVGGAVVIKILQTLIANGSMSYHELAKRTKIDVEKCHAYVHVLRRSGLTYTRAIPGYKTVEVATVKTLKIRPIKHFRVRR